VTELVEHKQSVENSLSMFRNEMIKIRKGMSARNLTVISEKLEATSRDSSSKLGKLGDRLYEVQSRSNA
jgi:dsDNA-specific endonuclease/ATPase MutS2